MHLTNCKAVKDRQRPQMPRRPLTWLVAPGSQQAAHFTWKKWGSPTPGVSIWYL